MAARGTRQEQAVTRAMAAGDRTRAEARTPPLVESGVVVKGALVELAMAVVAVAVEAVAVVAVAVMAAAVEAAAAACGAKTRTPPLVERGGYREALVRASWPSASNSVVASA